MKINYEMKNMKLNFKLIMVFVLIVIMTSFVFGATAVQNYSNNNFNLIGGKASFNIPIDMSKSLVGWRCDFNYVPTSVKIGDCYCMDTKGLTGVYLNDGVGYGDLYSCISKGNSFNVSSASGYTNAFSMKLYVNVSLSNTTAQNVNIYKLDDKGFTVVCNHTQSTPVVVYYFYNSKTGYIYYKGFKNSAVLPNVTISGSQIKCKVDFYDGWSKISSTSSSNTVVVDNRDVIITDSYLAPAYPDVSKTLYCYGSTSYSLVSSLSARQTFTLYRNGVEADSQVITQGSTGGSNRAGFDLSSYTKGDVMTCKFSVEVLNATNSFVLKENHFVTEPVTIVNARPRVSLVNINYAPLGVSAHGNSLLDIMYNEDKVGFITDLGYVVLVGSYYTSSSCVSQTAPLRVVDGGYGLAFVDSTGNMCVSNLVQNAASCGSGVYDVVNDGNVVASINKNGELCAKGQVVTNYVN